MSLFDGVPSGSPVDVWVNAKELASKGHSPENPFEVSGKVQSRKQRTSRFKDRDGNDQIEEVIQIIGDDGKVYGISGASTMWLNQINDSNPQPGDVCAYRYEGKQAGKNGAYHVHRFITAAHAEALKNGTAKSGTAQKAPVTAKVTSFEDDNSRALPF